jgi:hypothetical protein
MRKFITILITSFIAGSAGLQTAQAQVYSIGEQLLAIPEQGVLGGSIEQLWASISLIGLCGALVGASIVTITLTLIAMSREN